MAGSVQAGRGGVARISSGASSCAAAAGQAAGQRPDGMLSSGSSGSVPAVRVVRPIGTNMRVEMYLRAKASFSMDYLFFVCAARQAGSAAWEAGAADRLATDRQVLLLMCGSIHPLLQSLTRASPQAH